MNLIISITVDALAIGSLIVKQKTKIRYLVNNYFSFTNYQFEIYEADFVVVGRRDTRILIMNVIKIKTNVE